MIPVICLMGPTAIGKTAIACQLLDRFPVEIISVDSALVYRDLSIGTAKPCSEMLARYPHHLINQCALNESYSAGQFLRDVIPLIRQITHRNRVPLLCGGTMLYFHVLQQGLDALPGANATIRQNIQAQAAQHGWPALHQQLHTVNPRAAAAIHPHDQQRISRALEIASQPAVSVPRIVSDSLSFHSVVLMPASRQHLHQQIASRWHSMLEAGMLDECRQIAQTANFDPSLPSMRLVGYRQAWQYLDGQCSYEQFVEKGLAATRQLAKRQITWLRRWPESDHCIGDNLLQQVINRISPIFHQSDK